VSLLKSVITRTRLLFGRNAAETRMEEEMRFHLEMEAERLEREEGVSPAEARRRARVAFGGQDSFRETMREGRGLAWLSGFHLDLKLGTRMLLKYPVLTLASIVAIAVAIGLAASWFEFMGNIVYPKLGLAESDRIVQIRMASTEDGGVQPKTLHDFETFRDQSRSLREVSATTNVSYIVSTEGGRFAMVSGVRATAAMFPITRVQPLYGRTLTERDYAVDAGLAVVLGEDVFDRLFDGDRSAIGQTVRVGAEYGTLVGVMPADFGFPVNAQIWVPLRETGARYARLDGPNLMMMARLAPGVSLREAQAELDVIGNQTASAFPATHDKLRPEVRRFARGSDMSGPALGANVPLVFFLFVVCANVATLTFARTATRESEIAMRSALGASRSRIVLQLMSESLVMTTLAAVVGLTAAHYGMKAGMDVFWEVQGEKRVFWFTSGLSLSTIIYGVLLAAFGAVVIGGIPGLRATSRRLRERIGQPGAAGMKFGRIATGVIVVQVALCVAFIPLAIMRTQDALPDEKDLTFDASEFLTGRITTFVEGAPEQRAQLFEEAAQRLAAEPGVIAATRASWLPGINHGVDAFDIEGDSILAEARQLAVDPNFFDVMEARIVNGRGFTEADVTSDARVAIVDDEWAAETFLGRNPIGQRIRPAVPDGERERPWHEIVGVVDGMERGVGPGSPVGLYVPFEKDPGAAVRFYARTEAPPATMATRIQTLISAVDPALAPADVAPLDETWAPVIRSTQFFVGAFAVISLIILLFALIGIYALMSFTVAQRAREIGIRAALGANPRRILLSIFKRGLAQIALGIAAGGLLISLTLVDSPESFNIVLIVAASMAAVGIIACVLPAARALRIQPVDALRSSD
jgi:putative ABC transport system permease protein